MRLLEDIVELFILGVFGTLFLSGLGLFLFGIYLTIVSPKLLFLIFGILLLILIVGWCVKHVDDFGFLFKKIPTTTPFKSTMFDGIPVLSKLYEFEQKYKFNTLTFMNHVYHNNIPFGMNNLDYLEWLSLVNDLPTIMDDKKGDK